MNFLDFDIFLLKLINRPFLNFLNIFFIVIVYSVYGFLFLLFFVLYRRKNLRKILHLFISALIGISIVTILKYFFNRTRPDFNPVLIRADPSFPSRHSFVAGLTFYFSKIFERSFRIISAIYLILIPLGSVYLGVHYPSDVIVGFAIGYAMPLIFSEKLSFKIFQKLEFSLSPLAKVLSKLKK